MCNTKNHDFYTWLSGLIDGEGHFGMYKSAESGKNHYRRIIFEFRLKLRDDDGDILYDIQDKLGFGKIYHIKASATIPNAKPQLSFQLHSASDAAMLVDILDGHPLRSKKKKDYGIWREAIILAHDYNVAQYEIFEPFAKMIKNARAYVPPA